jgi:hypothetical protein
MFEVGSYYADVELIITTSKRAVEQTELEFSFSFTISEAAASSEGVLDKL